MITEKQIDDALETYFDTRSTQNSNFAAMQCVLEQFAGSNPPAEAPVSGDDERAIDWVLLQGLTTLILCLNEQPVSATVREEIASFARSAEYLRNRKPKDPAHAT